MKFTEYYKGDKLVEWLINLIETQYKNDIALVIRCNSLAAPGYEDNIFPTFYIPVTEKGKEPSCSFIIGGKSHDFFYWEYDCFEKFGNAAHYDTMVLADSVCLYAKSEEDYKRYQDCRKELFENIKNSEHMKHVAVGDYLYAAEIYKDCCHETSLSNVMFNGGYVCDLLVHTIASMNNRYIPQSFTNQYEFLESCKNKPDGFKELYLKINRSKNTEEINRLCGDMIEMMKTFLNYDEEAEIKYANSHIVQMMKHAPFISEKRPDFDIYGLAGWYEEMIYDWSRIRGFAKQDEPLNVHGWAVKLQFELWFASKYFGIEEYPLLEKFDENDMTEFLKYADWVESDIRKILSDNNAKLNEFAAVDEFIEAFENKKVRL